METNLHNQLIQLLPNIKLEIEENQAALNDCLLENDKSQAAVHVNNIDLYQGSVNAIVNNGVLSAAQTTILIAYFTTELIENVIYNIGGKSHAHFLAITIQWLMP